VNAAASLLDAQISFDHVVPASHSSTITPNERVVLKRFFGIEAAEMEGPTDHADPNPDWNATPEQVVPLTEVEDVPETEVEETPTVEVEPPINVEPPPIVLPSIGNARESAFSPSRIAVVVCLLLLVGLTVGALVLRSKLKGRQEATVASVVETQSSPVPESMKSASPSSLAGAARPDTYVRAANVPERNVNVQDLTGEWRVINTVEKTAYKSFDKMEVGFRLVINQRGNAFTAKGEKFSENGQTLPTNSRTPIRVTGTVEGDKVVATFVEDGRTRRTNGRFVWKLQNASDRLAGTFVSTAANTSGRSAVTKQ
jgi:hypothetical protein